MVGTYDYDQDDSDFSSAYYAGSYNESTQTHATKYFTVAEGDIQNQWDGGFTPIVLDLNKDGVQTLARLDNSPEFDLIGDGTKLKSGWLSAQDGLLALDQNGDGQINSINELFGGLNKGDGFAKLAAFDSNADGLVNAQDARFAELQVWRDADSDRVTDAGELLGLVEAGVTSLTVDYTERPELDANRNLHLERSTATLADGSVIDMTDVYFNVASADAVAAGINLPSMAELLGDNSLDSLLGQVEFTGPLLADNTVNYLPAKSTQLFGLDEMFV